VAAAELGASVRVVTDCAQLAEAAAQAGALITFVREPCASGTDRLAAAWHALDEAERPDLVLNLQGDEPLVPPDALVSLARFALAADAPMATAMIPGAAAPGEVSVVVDGRDRALYFSRAALPGRHPSADANDLRPAWGRHVGLYVYGAELLRRWPQLTPGTLERVEGLEQLRALEHGIDIAVMRLAAARRPWFAIDTEADLQRLVALVAPNHPKRPDEGAGEGS